jgi:8-oxo-dGTP pyrophosphatase MutT (NUDIX family)
MIEEKSCGILVFRERNGQHLYLLLHYEEGHWDFPKGHVEKNESETETALRETREETGLTDMKILPGFRKHIDYFYDYKGKEYHKTVYFFLGRTDSERVVTSKEHIGSMWLAYGHARKKLTFENAKDVLDSAAKFLGSI